MSNDNADYEDVFRSSMTERVNELETIIEDLQKQVNYLTYKIESLTRLRSLDKVETY